MSFYNLGTGFITLHFYALYPHYNAFMKTHLDYQLLGKRIAEWRKNAKITQEDLAFLTGMSIPFISEIEHGKKKPSLETIVSIANALDITLDEIMVGNQLITPTDYQSDIDLLLHDCSGEERRLLYETMKSLKLTLRQNRWIINKEEENL